MLEIRNLEFHRGTFELSLGLRLEGASIGVVLGRSGSGKSTLLRLIAGLERPDGGSIRLDGREIAELPPERRKVGLVFQDYALFPHLSARKNIEYGPRLSGATRTERHARANRLAGAFGLVGLLDRHPHELSGGEAQRVALARSLAAGPGLLLLDEPFAALDPGLRRDLRGLLGAELRALGMTALHVTHDVEEALAIADRIFLVEGGRIVEEGKPAELFERPHSLHAARFLGGGAVIRLLGTGKRSGGRFARTAFGDFSIAEDCALRETASGFMFLPADSFIGAIAVGEGGTDGPDRFRCRVESSVYAGHSRRLSVVPEAFPDDGPGMGPGDSPSLAIGLPTSVVPEGATRLCLAIRRGSARFLEAGEEGSVPSPA